MAEIYCDAARVVVWLGEKDTAAAEAFSLLGALGDTDATRREILSRLGMEDGGEGVGPQ